MATVASVYASVPIPQRIVGNVSASKDGSVTIEYREPGMVKTSVKRFLMDDVVAYMEGEAGFVIALSSEPLTKMVGDMTIKDNKVIINSEAGKVVINRIAGATVVYNEVEDNSREAKVAARVAKVKGVKIKKADKKSKKSKGDKAAKADKKTKKDKGEKKKRKKNKE